MSTVSAATPRSRDCTSASTPNCGRKGSVSGATPVIVAAMTRAARNAPAGAE